MNSNITLSVLGLYTHDNTIFNNMVIPANVDRQTLINHILIECAEFEILYPDAEFMALAIENWSKSMLPTWNKLNTLFNVDLSPNNDYSFTRTLTGERSKTNDNDEVTTYNSTDARSGSDTVKNTGTQQDSGTNTINNTGTQTDAGTSTVNNTGTQGTSGTTSTTNTGTQSTSGSTTTQVSAYNSSNWENREKSITDNTRTDNLSESTSNSSTRTDNLTESATNSNTRTDNLTESATSSNTRTDDLTEQTTYGSQNKKTGSDSTAFDGQEDISYNETVSESGHKTSLSVLLEKNIEIAYHNIYEVITDDFKTKFCLLIY